MSEIEPHEVLLDKLAKKREAEISERKLEVPIFEKPFLFFLFFVFLSFFLFLSFCFYYQILKKKDFSVLAKENQFSISKIEAERGVIYDRNREQLTFNHLQFNLYFKKGKKENEKAVSFLSKVLGEDEKKLKEKIEKSKENEVLISKNLSYEKSLILVSKANQYPQIVLRKILKREYKDGPVFSHLIGYLGKISSKEYQKEKKYYTLFDFVGKEGIEKYYEKILRKKPGEILIERDAKGRKKGIKIVSKPEPGKNLILYLDAPLQRKIKEEMEKKIKEVKAKSGAAVAVDPQTGGVLSLFSYPTFDNNVFSFGLPEEIEKVLNSKEKLLLNRATSGLFPLGSTVKPLIAIAGLTENAILPSEKINCKGKIEIPHKYNPKITYVFKDWTVHGPTDVRKAIAESCDVFFYILGQKLGPTKIKNYLQEFGLGKLPKTDFPIPSLSKGLVGSPEWKKKVYGEPWWDGDTFNLSIGQGYILATPFQVAQAFLPIANGGKLLKLKFVWKILDAKGNLISKEKPEILKENFLDKKALEIVREGMRKTVTGEGAPKATAKSLSLLPVSSAAKTGTAQSSRKNCKGCYTTWIVVFAPFENPKILLVLTIDGVKDVSQPITIPVAKEILNWYFQRKENLIK